MWVWKLYQADISFTDVSSWKKKPKIEAQKSVNWEQINVRDFWSVWLTIKELGMSYKEGFEVDRCMGCCKFQVGS